MEDECTHGMNPDWCANCKGLKTPEEEKEILDREVENLHLRWDR